MPFSKVSAQESGRRGGLATKQRMLEKNPDYYATIGILGGQRLLSERGKDFFSKIGAMSHKRKAVKALRRAT